MKRVSSRFLYKNTRKTPKFHLFYASTRFYLKKMWKLLTKQDTCAILGVIWDCITQEWHEKRQNGMKNTLPLNYIRQRSRLSAPSLFSSENPIINQPFDYGVLRLIKRCFAFFTNRTVSLKHKLLDINNNL